MIYDVWNGDFDSDGAGPSSSALYMLEAFEDAACLLLPDGVFVLNYYGKEEGGDFRAVLRTIRRVFADTRVFHDAAREAAAAGATEAAAAPYNLIVFASMAGPVRFREPVDADFLGSTSIRRDALRGLPLREIRFDVEGADGAPVLRASEGGAARLWELQRDVRRAHAAALGAVNRGVREEL